MFSIAVWARGSACSTPVTGLPNRSLLTNEMLQNRINRLLGDSNQVQYVFSRYAKTNNGLYALMDVKST